MSRSINVIIYAFLSLGALSLVLAVTFAEKSFLLLSFMFCALAIFSFVAYAIGVGEIQSGPVNLNKRLERGAIYLLLGSVVDGDEHIVIIKKQGALIAFAFRVNNPILSKKFTLADGEIVALVD